MAAIHSGVSGVVWPAIPAPVSASLLAALFQLEQSQWLSKEQLTALQWQQIELLLDHAWRTVPFYGQHWAGGSLPRDWASFGRLPILNRHHLQRQGADLRSRSLPKDHGRTIPYATSGSIGTPLEGADSEVSHFLWNALNLREQLWQGRDLSRKFGAIRTKVQRSSLPNWGDPVARVFETGAAVTLNIATPVTEQIAWLRDERPGYLLTHPSNLRALAREALYQGADIHLDGLGTFGEILPADCRDLCRRAFGCDIADIYSAEEVGYIALQCPRTTHYHVMAENLLVEVLREDGEACLPGESGRVVLTTLHNFAMPLVRYQIGDYAVVGKPCPCGRGLPVLERVMGRQRNMLLHANGDRHWPSFPGEIWLMTPLIRQLQLVQLSVDRLEVRYVGEQQLTGDRCDRLIQELKPSLPFEGEIEFRRVDAIAQDPSGKFEDFVCAVRPLKSDPAET